MSLFSDPNQDVIYHILELLPTIGEALQHMQTQMAELRLEESAELFKDTAEAIGSIAYSILPLLNEDDDHQLLPAYTRWQQNLEQRFRPSVLS